MSADDPAPPPSRRLQPPWSDDFMLLRLRFTRPAKCCGFTFQKGDEMTADTDNPGVFFAIHQINPVWAEVVELTNAGTVEQVGDPLTASAVIQMVERRLALPAQYPRTG